VTPKKFLSGLFLTLGLSSLFAMNPPQHFDDAEARFRIKYGRDYPSTEARNQRSFGKLDRNRDGRIDQTEFEANRKHLDRKRNLTFSALDQNADGHITMAEWKNAGSAGESQSGL
jgi:hypothetical protein